MDTEPLLASHEPDPVMIGHPEGASPFFLVCDHAARRIPERLGLLGLAETEIARHIGWDIGIWEVSRKIADALDAPLIGQAYSRLVIDCNRPTTSPTSIPEMSEATPIPGNVGLSAGQRAARARELFHPYHDRIARDLDARRAGDLDARRAGDLDARRAGATVLVAMHSFTPVYKGVPRPWHAGVLFNKDLGTSRILLALLKAEPGLCVGENQPYAVSDTSDYTAPVHAEAKGLPYLEIEIRQDLIEHEAGQRDWAARMVRLLPEVWRRYTASLSPSS